MEWSGVALMSYGGGCGGGKMQNEANLWRKLMQETWGKGQNEGRNLR